MKSQVVTPNLIKKDSEFLGIHAHPIASDSVDFQRCAVDFQSFLDCLKTNPVLRTGFQT
jgi:hypothetical protein